MRLYLCFWLAGIYTYNAAIKQQPDPKVPPAMTRPPHLCLSIMGSDKEVAPSFRRLRNLSGVAYRCVHAESRGPSVQHASMGRHESSPPRAAQSDRSAATDAYDWVATRATATASHSKSQLAACSMCGRFHIGLVVMRCTRAPVRSSGSPRTSDVHAADKERRKSIATRATPRARSTQAR